MAISIHKSIDGIPTLISGYEILGLGFMAPEDVRNEISICNGYQLGVFSTGQRIYCLPERKENDKLDSEDFQ